MGEICINIREHRQMGRKGQEERRGVRCGAG